MTEWCGSAFGSPAGFHREAKRSRAAIETSGEQVLGMLGAGTSEGEILFTGNSTEAVSLGILGYARANRRFGRNILSSTIEGPAVQAALSQLKREGFEIRNIPVDGEGKYFIDMAEALMDDETLLICLHAGHSEIGTIQNLEDLASLARERSIACWVDATAAGGRMPLESLAASVDMLALAPSTFRGPTGVGLLYKRAQVTLEPLYFADWQDGGLVPSHENVAGIVGAGIAAERLRERLGLELRLLRTRQRSLWDALRTQVPGVRLVGPGIGSDRLAHQLTVTVEGVDAEGLVLFADLRGLAIATAGGCLSRGAETHYMLTEVGLSPEAAKQTITLSVSVETTEEEIENAVKIILAGAERLRSLSP